MKHVIIGAGAAGISAARTLREQDESAEILIISEDDFPYSRCMLPRYLSYESPEDDLRFTGPDFFKTKRIQWMGGTKVTGIDDFTSEVILQDRRIPFDKLLIACGTEPTIPDMGSLRTASNVFSFRHLKDAKRISKAADASDSVVIIDSGLIGLDAAYALLKRGKKVTVVESGDQILPFLLDKRSACTYLKKFEEDGCHFIFHAAPADTIYTGNKVTSILLDNQVELSCDIVIVAGSARPRLDFLKGTDITYGKFVHVDCCMHTNHPHIYAAGDVTGLSGIWPNAVEQGKVAALNMCGHYEGYDDIFSLRTLLNFYDLSTLSLGKVQFTPEELTDYSILTREDQQNYQKICLKGNYVGGVILQGDISHCGIWQHLIKNKIDISKYKDILFDLSFAHFYNTIEEGEYRWTSSANYDFTYRLSSPRL